MRIVAAALALLVGCGARSKIEVTARSPHPLHARGVEQVEVLLAPPLRPHVAVARIKSGRTNWWGLTEIPHDEAIAELRRAGAGLGCDAVTVVGDWRYRDRPTGMRQGVVGDCVVFTDGPPGDSP